MSTDLVSSSIAAPMIGLSRQRVHQLVAEGRLRALKIETSGNQPQLASADVIHLPPSEEADRVPPDDPW